MTRHSPWIVVVIIAWVLWVSGTEENPWIKIDDFFDTKRECENRGFLLVGGSGRPFLGLPLGVDPPGVNPLKPKAGK